MCYTQCTSTWGTFCTGRSNLRRRPSVGFTVPAPDCVRLEAAEARMTMVLVTRSIALNAKPADVWSLVGGFQAVPDWHPGVESSTPGTLGEVETRRLSIVGGGEIYEKSLGSDGMSYGYEILESPLPVANYRAIISVVDAGGKAVLVWSSTFEDMAEGAGAAAVVGVYEAGIAALTAKFP